MNSSELENLSRRGSDGSCSEDDRLRIIEEDQQQHEPNGEEFKEKILNTKLSEENKENNLPSQRKLLRGFSQVALPVKIE